MTLIELQKKLGEQIDLLTDDSLEVNEKSKFIDVAMTISSLAKQMINNADVVLRTEKLASEGKLSDATILRMISDEG